MGKDDGIVVGFDFGTTNSLISLIQGDQPIPLYADDDQPIPSVVCYEGGEIIVGRQAKERLTEVGLGIHKNIVRSPKSLLGKDSVYVEGVERSPVDIVADVVNYVRDLAVRSGVVEGLNSIERAVVAIPVGMDGQRRRALRDAFRKAGIAIVQFVHEPMAAIYDYFRFSHTTDQHLSRILEFENKLMLVFDWGGGTLDLTLCKIIDGMIVQLRNDGSDEMGGDLFDSELRATVIRRVRTEKGLSDDVAIRVGGEEVLLNRAERAKIDLSSRSSATIFVRNFFEGAVDEDLEYALTRDELEDITGLLVDRGIERIQALLRTTDVSPAQISLCLATGGMVNMPKIKARLHELFEPSRVHISRAGNAAISTGAAWVAYDERPMQLAKNVELSVARQSRIQLIPAGTEMPKEGEVCEERFELYTTDPTDGKAYFQLESPVKPGKWVLQNDRRNVLMNLVVSVDREADPYFERLILVVTIDQNLILTANAQSLVTKNPVSSEAHDLEFGLKLPGSELRKNNSTEPQKFHSSRLNKPEKLTIRSNIANHKDDETLVPGEVLFRWKPGRFNKVSWNANTRYSKPTKIQLDERQYYYFRRCPICGLYLTDPACHCNSSPVYS